MTGGPIELRICVNFRFKSKREHRKQVSMDVSLLSLLILSTVVCSAATSLLLFKHRRPRPKIAAGAATTIIKPYPIIGNLPHIIKNGPRILDWITELVSASPTGTVTVAPLVFTADPAAVEHTARAHFTSYEKGPTITSGLREFLGHGILNVNGDSWRLQRKTASFEFSSRSLRAFVHDTVRREIDTRLIPLLTDAAKTGSILDLQEVLERFAFDNICSLVFDADPAVLGSVSGAAEDGERFYHAFEEVTNLSILRWSYPFHWMWKLMRWLNAGSERRLRASLDVVNRSIEKYMRQSRGRTGRSDLFSRFAESGEHEDSLLRDVIASFLLAGRDTTPSALTWFFWATSSAPDVMKNIVEEIRQVRLTGVKGVLSLDELRGMHYLHSVVTESMRLYPPVAIMPRDCVVDDVLPDGTVVRKGWTVMYSAYAMGRSERLWGKGWAEFRPERWMEEGVFKPESSFRYSVFHAGPRMCLGKEMAYIQMKALVAAVVDRFELEVVGERGAKEVMITLKMVGGLPVRVKERKG